MRQLEIWRLTGDRGGSGKEVLAVILQHDLLRDLDTCIVAPLRPRDELPPIGRLRPEVTLERRQYRLIIGRLSVVRRRALAERIGTVSADAEEIRRALDELLVGA